jgi:hypothetical protein
LRDLIDAGVLRRFGTGRLLAGPCRVAHNCTVCGGDITLGEPEAEIVSGTGAVAIHLHRACLEVWKQEVRDGDGPP